LRALDLECKDDTDRPTYPTAATTLCPVYSCAFTATFGDGLSARQAIDAFSAGTLSAALDLNETYDQMDRYIRANPPVWLDSMADTQQRPADLATVCAELYTTLRSGFHILPPGTHVDVPTETSNYKSIDDNIDDVRAEIGRLRKLGHLISWDTAQQRHPSLRDKRRPDHVLALGAVVKSKPGGRKKTRLVIDPSRATTRASPHAEVAGLNDSIELPGCRLPTVTQASKAMTRRCWMFKADATDAFMQTKHSVDSLRLMGIVFDGALMVYNSLCFGLKSAPAHQQRLATIFSRVVMRRWKASGIDIGAVPGCDLMQAWPVSGDRKAYMFSYLDDFYGCGFRTKTEADTAYGIFLSTAEELGLELQYDDDKTVPATQKTDFLGVIFSSREMSLSLSKERIAKMVADLRDLRAADTISVADLMRLIGVLMFATVVFSLCRPYLRQMMSLLRTAGPEPAKQRRLPIPSTVVDDIAMWLQIFTTLGLNNRPISGLPSSVHRIRAELYTDASFVGGGYFVGGIWRMWKWPSDMRARIGRFNDFSPDERIFIVELEALALLQAIRDLAPLFSSSHHGGRRLVCHIDNDPLVAMLRKHSTRSDACTPILRELTGILLSYSLELVPVWIASAANEVADKLTRTDEISPDDLLETIRRWSATHPDVTSWSARPASRPDLLCVFDRHPFEAAGEVQRGIRPAASSFRSGICPSCGSDPCGCGPPRHRIWTRDDGPFGR